MVLTVGLILAVFNFFLLVVSTQSILFYKFFSFLKNFFKKKSTSPLSCCFLGFHMASHPLRFTI